VAVSSPPCSVFHLTYSPTLNLSFLFSLKSLLYIRIDESLLLLLPLLDRLRKRKLRRSWSWRIVCWVVCEGRVEEGKRGRED